MMTTAKQEKRLTLRQQMRVTAEQKLVDLSQKMYDLASTLCEEVSIDGTDLMHFYSASQTATLQNKLVTQLANQVEDEWVKKWNDQQDLPLGDDDAD